MVLDAPSYEELAHQVLERLGLRLSPEFKESLDCIDFEEKIDLGGVRAGKSTKGAAEIVTDPRFYQGKVPKRTGELEPALFWIVGPTYLAAQKEMSYVLAWANKMGLVKHSYTPSEGPQRLELKNGAIIETRSAQHKERLASDAPHKILVVEAGQIGPGIREQIQGRALENNAQIIYNGTLEDAENNPRFAWYEQTAAHWQQHVPGVYCDECDLDGSKKRAFSLPSWSNIAVFPERESDPKIQRLRRDLDGITFDRMVGGKPSGFRHPAYPQLDHPEPRLLPLPDGIKWTKSAGGIDYGDVHPSALVVVSLSNQTVQTASELIGNQKKIAWVRECWWDGDQKAGNVGDTQRLRSAFFRLRRKYNAFHWRTDPNERFMAGQFFIKAVKMGKGTRGNRIGQVRARLNGWTLFFDMNGHGVPELYAEMSNVHYKTNNKGELELVRLDDDRTAALENAIDALDGENTAVMVDYSRKLETGKTDWGKIRSAR